MSEKPGVLTFTDSTVSVIVDGSSDKPVVWKVISREGAVYKYNGGEVFDNPSLQGIENSFKAGESYQE